MFVHIQKKILKKSGIRKVVPERENKQKHTVSRWEERGADKENWPIFLNKTLTSLDLVYFGYKTNLDVNLGYKNISVFFFVTGYIFKKNYKGPSTYTR